ncbi:MAG: metallophosphoesterase [Proteobacteria bacterium]|nr:metallophosphoesterase [Pseudomonadota bacterium]
MDRNAALEVSEWRSARFDVEGESIFAVGDVHGCARELQMLLATIAATATPGASRRRLVYLGDMIDRGPENLEVLRLWAEGEACRGVDRIDRIMGNHEQLLLLTTSDGPHARKAEAMWLSERMGGERVLEEMRASSGDANARPSLALLTDVLGQDVVGHLHGMRSHSAVGNALFVHGGLDPKVEPEEFLSRPWTSFTDAAWAWIMQGFLDWQGGFGGRIVVHGHTPPAKHRALTGQEDPHLLMFDRLGLDGGSALTSIVAGAQIEDGRYRVMRAGTPRRPD